ncbi:Wzz/FepE/Etk N-terminal domain-containing protein, partial [Arthrospira platensis SPKY1]|nr:Wzz/FepE/Etk N-terminal domain-containing protein [Arthrospira platensis SPKY1]
QAQYRCAWQPAGGVNQVGYGEAMLRLVTLRILESYFQHRWLYFLPLVLMIGLGAYYAFDAKPTYTAKGVLYVETQSYLASLTNVSGTGSDPAWWKTPAQVTNEEIGELLQTDAFVRAIIRQTDLETE